MRGVVIMSEVNQEIFAQVEEIFLDTFTDDSIEFSLSIQSDDIEEWDSLTHIRLLTALEAEFGFQFDIEEIERLNSVSIIIETIQSKL